MPDLPTTSAEKQKLAIITTVINKKITNGEAAKKLGLSVRQVQRLKAKVQQDGKTAVIHKLKGRVSNHHIDPQIKQALLNEIKLKYPDFKPKFATEKIQEKHNISLTSQTIRVWMAEEGLWKVRKQKTPEYRSWRERLPYFGELEQFDGSYHYWLEERLLDEEGNPLEACLLASIDDATGKITHAKFELNEGVVPVFTFWQEYVEENGKPLKIYLDKYSTYKINHKIAVDNSDLLTHFQKAMKLLGVELISANSPEAKGRVERLFGTLQDRLVKELRLANINTLEGSNKFLKGVFIPQFNAKFSVRAAKAGDIHKTLTQEEKQDLTSIFSVKSLRKVNNDYTLQFKNHFYQLEEIQPLTIRPKERVQVEEWLDQTLHFRFQGQELNYSLLPEKPLKVKTSPAILTTHPLNWRPPLNHPWRKSYKGLSSSRG